MPPLPLPDSRSPVPTGWAWSPWHIADGCCWCQPTLLVGQSSLEPRKALARTQCLLAGLATSSAASIAAQTHLSHLQHPANLFFEHRIYTTVRKVYAEGCTQVKPRTPKRKHGDPEPPKPPPCTHGDACRCTREEYMTSVGINTYATLQP
jgi:hypothetical protein